MQSNRESEIPSQRRTAPERSSDRSCCNCAPRRKLRQYVSTCKGITASCAAKKSTKRSSLVLLRTKERSLWGPLAPGTHLPHSVHTSYLSPSSLKQVTIPFENAHTIDQELNLNGSPASSEVTLSARYPSNRRPRACASTIHSTAIMELRETRHLHIQPASLLRHPPAMTAAADEGNHQAR